jgi:hypothetical protein
MADDLATTLADPRFGQWMQMVQAGKAAAAGVDPTFMTVSQKYGNLAAYLHHPELGPIIQQAAREGWSAELLQGKLQQTTWWNTHTAAARELDLLQNQDPASYAKKQQAAGMKIMEMAQTLGVHIDAQTANDIGHRTLMDPSMTDQDIKWMIGAQLVYDAHAPNGGAGGQIGGTIMSAKQRAADYGVNVTDRWAFDISKQIGQGYRTPDDVEAELREKAKQQYSWLAPEIDSGRTIKELFDTQVATAAQLLEVDPESIDLRDPKWNPIISTVDKQTGVRRSMTTGEVAEYVRGTAGYDQTTGAMDTAAKFAENLMQTFGKVAS